MQETAKISHMGAPTRNQTIIQVLRNHEGIQRELDRLEKAANRNIRKTLPSYRYPHEEFVRTLIEDLASTVASEDWRRPLKSVSDCLRRAAKNIRDAVKLVLKASTNCPTYATIPPIVWESTPEAETERKRISLLPETDSLFGKGGAIESLRRPLLTGEIVRSEFLKAMLVYAGKCQREAARIDRIRKARSRHYDRLGPILNLLQDVQNSTGDSYFDCVARLLTDAHEISGKPKTFSADQLRKYRERYLTS